MLKEHCKNFTDAGEPKLKEVNRYCRCYQIYIHIKNNNEKSRVRHNSNHQHSTHLSKFEYN